MMSTRSPTASRSFSIIRAKWFTAGGPIKRRGRGHRTPFSLLYPLPRPRPPRPLQRPVFPDACLSRAIDARVVRLYLWALPFSHYGGGSPRFHGSDFSGGLALSGCEEVPTPRGNGSPEDAV